MEIRWWNKKIALLLAREGSGATYGTQVYLNLKKEGSDASDLFGKSIQMFVVLMLIMVSSLIMNLLRWKNETDRKAQAANWLV